MQAFYSWANTKVAQNSFNDPNVQKNVLKNEKYQPYGQRTSSSVSWTGQAPVQQNAAKAGAKFGGEFTGKNATAYLGIPKGKDGTGVSHKVLGTAILSAVEIAGLSNSAVFSKGGHSGQAVSAAYNGSTSDAANYLR